MRQSLYLISMALLATACAGESSTEVVPPGSIDEPVTQQMRRQLRPPGLGRRLEDGVVIDLPPTEEGGPPFPVKTILVTGRTSSSVSLRWHDRSDVEDGTRLRRRESTGGWQNVAAFGPLSGFNDVTDGSLSPDRLYCYQFVAFNDHGDSFSPQRCAYTRGEETRPVFRAQLTLQTGDVSNAGTDGRVTVRLNSPPSIYTPSGNATVVDYGRDDFERGDSFTYDLELNGLSNLEDVTLVNLSKTGDGWCVEATELLINNRRVFGQSFGNTGDPCLWLDTYTISHEALRGHVDWQDFVQTFPRAFDRDEIESRIEGMIGNLIAASDRVSWGDRNGRGWVEATRKNHETVHIDLDLEGETWWINPDVDVDFDVIFRFNLRDEQWELDITTANLELDVDFDWFTKTMSVILPCGPAVSIALDKGIPDCISELEDYIADEIRRGWQPIARHFLVGTPCPDGLQPEATVIELEGELTSVSFGCAEDASLPLPEAPEPGPVIGGGSSGSSLREDSL